MRICPKCSVDCSETSKFCMACGTALGDAVERASAQEFAGQAETPTDTVADMKDTVAASPRESHSLPASSSSELSLPAPQIPDYTIGSVLELSYCFLLGLAALIVLLRSQSARSAGRNDIDVQKTAQAKKCLSWGIYFSLFLRSVHSTFPRFDGIAGILMEVKSPFHEDY